MPAETAAQSLTLDYVPCPGGAQLVRVYGDTPCPTLPETVDGLPLAALGPYCFAETQRESELPPASALRRSGTGACPAGEESGLHRIGGRFLQRVFLPESLTTIGSCAFYNCRALTQLSVGSRIDTYGSDVFLNTFALHTIQTRTAPDTAGSLFRLVNNLTADLAVQFAPDGKTVRAAAFYPEYWEDIEETPAHILLHTYSGQGYHYRQCFLEGVPRWEEYDAVFPMSQSEDPPAAMAQLAFGRLRWPWELSAHAAAQYRTYLADHAAALLDVLLQRADTVSLAALLALDILDTAALQAGAAAAVRAENAAFAALLTNALHTAQPVQSASRYDFDF